MSALLELNWPDLPLNVAAAFTLRGADPEGDSRNRPYAAFNLATHVGDDSAAVETNRRRLGALLKLPCEPVWLRQMHGRAVLDLDNLPATNPGSAFEADAAVTSKLGAVCAIQVADCLPVLFASLDGSRIGAAHAGWRGLAGGVLEATIRALRVEPQSLTAWIGPGISQEHFEVADEVRVAFDGAAGFAANARGRWQCDLAGLAARRLRAAGLTSIAMAGECTFSDPGRFFSYRRDRVCGRMAALIWRSARVESA